MSIEKVTQEVGAVVWRVRWREADGIGARYVRPQGRRRSLRDRGPEATADGRSPSGRRWPRNAGRVRREVVEDVRGSEPRAQDEADLRRALGSLRPAAARHGRAPRAHTRAHRELPRRSDAAGVGDPTVRKTLAFLQGILQRAVEWRRIDSNPAKAVRKPPQRKTRVVDSLGRGSRGR